MHHTCLNECIYRIIYTYMPTGCFRAFGLCFWCIMIYTRKQIHSVFRATKIWLHAITTEILQNYTLCSLYNNNGLKGHTYHLTSRPILYITPIIYGYYSEQ